MRLVAITALSVFVTLVLAVRAVAAGLTPFTADALERAQSSGAVVVVDFHADWCPTCRAQAPLLRALAVEPELEHVVFLVADFDRETALRRALRVGSQSTLVVFHGKTEAARASGVTKLDDLRTLIRKGE
jgi:thioredoxin 1